jgi:hypothetical protein
MGQDVRAAGEVEVEALMGSNPRLQGHRYSKQSVTR